MPRLAQPRRSVRTSVIALLAVTTLVGAGCGGTDDAVDVKATGPTTTFAFPKDEMVDATGQAVVEIAAIDNTLEPRYVEISVGTRVIWKNEGRNPHDILPGVDGAFDGATASAMPPGATHTVTFDTAGDFPYYCSTHGTMKNGMNGAIRVVAPS